MDPRTEDIPLTVGEIPDLWILADALAAHQVLTNLLTNARKAVQQRGDGLVAVRGEVVGTAFHMVVVDTGCGMEADQVERLFVPFASDFQEGTGLGMSLVYQFVRQMGWEIRVESRPGQGTQVHLKVPVAA
jgi:signal transduction histidine kinase